MDYAAFMSFCNDFDFPSHGLTRIDLGTVYAVAAQGINKDCGLDCPGLFDMLILVVRARKK